MYLFTIPKNFSTRLFFFLIYICPIISLAQSRLSMPTMAVNEIDTLAIPVFLSSDSAITFVQFTLEYNSNNLQPLTPFSSVGKDNNQLAVSLINTNLPFQPQQTGANANVLFQLSGGGTNSLSGDSLEILLLNFAVQGNQGDSLTVWFDDRNGRTLLTTINAIDIQGKQLKLTDGHLLLRAAKQYPPRIQSINDTTAIEDSLFVMQVTAADSNAADSLLFSDDTPLFDINSQTGLISFTPENSDVGTHEITIFVTDGISKDSTQFELTIQNVNDPPEAFDLLAPANGSILETLNPLLVWKKSIDIDIGDSVKYSVILSYIPDFSDTLLFSNTADTSFTVSGVLERARTYYWKIIATDQAGSSRSSTSNFSFFTSSIATTVRKDAGNLPSYFSLLPAYPNPFNPETRIAFTVPRQARVTLSVFNALGQLVETLYDKTLEAGVYTSTWSATRADGRVLPSGVYIVVLRAENFVQTQKIVLLR